MNATELAHWRYRVKAIPADIKSGEEALRSAAGFFAAPYRPDTERQARLITRIKEMREGLQRELDFNRYLLEEARYMVELGELTLT